MKPTLTAGIFRVLFRMVAASLPFFCISSCSVKEERTGCPCILSIYPDPSVEFTRYDKFGNTIRLVNEENGQVYSVKQFPKGSFTDGEPVIMSIVKGTVSFYAVFDLSNGDVYGTDNVIIREGCQADSVFVHRNTLNCYGESASDTLRLKKQWCSLFIHLSDGNSYLPGDVKLESSWDGFDAATLAPHGGAFVFTPDTLSRNKYLIRVPRQADKSMKLTVHSAFFPKIYPLGEYIAESGFDWQKESLDDAIIFIDKATVKVEILTKEWDNGTDYGTVEF